MAISWIKNSISNRTEIYEVKSNYPWSTESFWQVSAVDLLHFSGISAHKALMKSWLLEIGVFSHIEILWIVPIAAGPESLEYYFQKGALLGQKAALNLWYVDGFKVLRTLKE